MSRRWSIVQVAAALALALAALAPAPAARAEELALGVFLPQATFATNAERTEYAQKLAERLTAAVGGDTSFRARVFARRDDATAFLQARNVDVLVTDGLLLVDLAGADVVAHALGETSAALYGRDGVTVEGLAGKTVAVVEAGQDDANFFANAALAGELAPKRYFGDLRRSKDAAAAFGAVRASAADAAFGPEGHPAASGLVLLAKGGALPVAVAAFPVGSRVPATARPTIVAALTGGAGVGGGIKGWAGGAGDALGKARGLAAATPRVLTATPILAAGADEGKLTPPPIRLETSGELPKPVAPKGVSVAPELPESGP